MVFEDVPDRVRSHDAQVLAPGDDLCRDAFRNSERDGLFTWAQRRTSFSACTHVIDLQARLGEVVGSRLCRVANSCIAKCLRTVTDIEC